MLPRRSVSFIAARMAERIGPRSSAGSAKSALWRGCRIDVATAGQPSQVEVSSYAPRSLPRFFSHVAEGRSPAEGMSQRIGEWEHLIFTQQTTCDSMSSLTV